MNRPVSCDALRLNSNAVEHHLRSSLVFMRRAAAVLIGLLAGGCAASGRADSEQSSGIDVGALALFVEAQRERSFDDTWRLEGADGTVLELFVDGVPAVEFVTATEMVELLPSVALEASDWRMLRLLGVVAGNDDRDEAKRGLDLAVSGWCCPIRVVSSGDDVVDAAVVVHELTHQLEFLDMAFPPGDQSLEWWLYATAAFEGDAERIRGEYLTEVGVSAERWDELDPPPQGVPDKLIEVFDFPYSHGADFMRAVANRGGEAAIDAALRTPPLSSKQVMFPEAYFAGEAPVKVDNPTPSAGRQDTRAGTVGAFLLYLAIRDSVGHEVAEGIVSQWQGDSYVVSTSIERSCLDASVVMAGPTSAEGLALALTDTSSRYEEPFEVSVLGDTVHVTRCVDRAG